MQNTSFGRGVIAAFVVVISAAVLGEHAQQYSAIVKSAVGRQEQRAANDMGDWPSSWKSKRPAVIAEQEPAEANHYQHGNGYADDGGEDRAIARQSARADERQADYAELGLWVGAVAALATAWAAIEAGRAATAAKDAAQVSKNALVNVQRAFILADDAKLIKSTIDTGDVPQAYFASVRWINKGTTWAKHCAQWTGVSATTDDLPETHDFFAASGDDASAIPRATVIGPGGDIRSAPIRIDAQRISVMMSSRMKFYFYGWMEYDDVFDGTKRHRTEFCFKLVPMHSIEADGRGTVEGQFQHHAGHNGADDDCKFPLRTGSPKNPLPNS